MEDHHDDCGDDLASLNDRETAAAVFPCDFDTDDQLSDEDHDNCLKRQMGQFAKCISSRHIKSTPGTEGELPRTGARSESTETRSVHLSRVQKLTSSERQGAYQRNWAVQISL